MVPYHGKGLAWEAKRQWRFAVGHAPPLWGWYSTEKERGRLVRPVRVAAPDVEGYFGERGAQALIVGDAAWTCAVRVKLVVPLPPEDLPRFSLVKLVMGRDHCGYVAAVLPDTAVEEAVRLALAEERTGIDTIPGVTPAHRAAFGVYTQARAQARQQQALIEAQRQAEDARRRAGSPAGRRMLAASDPEEACRAALRVSGGVLLGFRRSGTDLGVVDWSCDGRPFQCIVKLNGLGLHDPGICLTSHETGEEGGKLITLEALPSVVREARDTNKLVVFRHVGDEEVTDDPWSD